MIQYTLSLACDTDGCGTTVSFSAATAVACRDAARQARWLLQSDGVRARCPTCVVRMLSSRSTASRGTKRSASAAGELWRQEPMKTRGGHGA